MRARSGTATATAAAIGVVLFAARTVGADERPSTAHLIEAGLAMALPTYAIGLVAHEGSHALAGKLVGAEVREMHLWPGFRRGKFYFGYVEVSGLWSDGQRAWFLLAPKLTSAAMLGGYAAAYFSGAYPANRYGQLALTVLATGFWVDFTRDVFAFWEHSDVIKAYHLADAHSETGRLPYRLLHAGLAAAAAVAIIHGYRDVFAEPALAATPLLVPLLQGRF